jgi:putative ABC transport system permease protein
LIENVMAQDIISSDVEAQTSQGFAADHFHFPSIRPILRSIVQGREGVRLQLLTLCVSLLPGLCLVSVLAETVWKPLPFREAANLYVMARSTPFLEDVERDARRLEAAPAIESVGFFSTGEGSLQTQAGSSQRMQFAVVSKQFFPVLGVGVLFGRIPQPDEVADSPGRPVVISERLFQSVYGNSPGAVGQSCVINGIPGHIVAVVQNQNLLLAGVDAWMIRQRREDGLMRGAISYKVLLRLRDHAQPGIAAAQIMAANETGAGAGRAAPTAPTLTPLRTYLYRDHETALTAAAWVVGSLFLIGLINSIAVYTFELLRSQRDMALRLALGSSLRQLALDIMVRQQVYASAGWLMAALLCPLFAAGIADFEGLAPSGFSHQWATLAALLACWAVVVASASVVSVAQLWIIRRVNLLSLLQDNARSATGSRQGRLIQNIIVCAQLTVTLAMLIAAARVTHSYWTSLNTALGMSAKDVMVLDVEMPPTANTPEGKRLMLGSFMTSLSSQLPVERSGAVNYLPLDTKQSILLMVEPLGSGSALSIPSGFRVVEGAYFQSLGIPVVEGRMFDSRIDGRGEGQCVVLVNSVLARQLGGGAGALGQSVRIPGVYERCQIIGLVGAVRHQGPNEEPAPEFYVPFGQLPSPFMTVVVKLSRPYVLSDVRAAVRASRGGLSVSEPRTMLSLLEGHLHSQRSRTLTLCLVAIIAFLLTQLGLYGLVSRTIAGQARRIAIEMALGAPVRVIIWVILKWVLCVIGLSVVVGTVMASFVSSRIVGASPEAWVSVLPTLIVTAVSLLGAMFSVARILRKQPAQVLRWSGL